MVARRFALSFFLGLPLLFASTGCFRSHTWKRDTAKIPEKIGKLPDPVIKPQSAPAPVVSAIQPPHSDQLSGPVPAMPGMPGSPSQPIETPKPPSGLPATVPDSPIAPVGLNPTAPEKLVSNPGEDGEGPIRRAIENLRERREERKEQPKLPPAIAPMESPTPPVPPGAEPNQSVAPPRINVARPQTAPGTSNTGHVAVARKLLDLAVAKYADVPDYECRFVRREVVNGKPMPLEELVYQFRKEPMSVYMRVTGESGRGREVLYVKGQNAGKITIVTGEGDNRLLGVGKKMDFEPDSPMVMAKSRHRITDAGMGRQLTTIGKFVEAAEKGTRPPETIRSLGLVERKEFPKPVEGIEFTLLPGDDPLLPKGGKRTYYFDTDPQSQAMGLPVLLITHELGDREVEYYCFDRFRMPAKLSDFDFSPDRLGKRK